MGERHSEFERDADDFYVEPDWCVDRLLDRYHVRALHDPCCGSGNIVDTALRRGIDASGADLRDRAYGRFQMQNFLTDTHPRASIITNPPFKIAPSIVAHALTLVEHGGIVAIVAQAKFLFRQARHPLFTRHDFERVIVLSRRPSMPPGKMLEALGEDCRGGGSIDFLWAVWRVGKAERGAVIEWTL